MVLRIRDIPARDLKNRSLIVIDYVAWKNPMIRGSSDSFVTYNAIQSTSEHNGPTVQDETRILAEVSGD